MLSPTRRDSLSLLNERGLSVGDFPPLAVETDDTGRLQRAINAANQNYPCQILWIPAGTYNISAQLTDNAVGNNYVKIVGAGWRNTVIAAKNSMSSMLILSNTDSNYYGEKVVMGIRFDGGYLAQCGIDASNLTYSIIEECGILNMAPGGWAIKCGSWVNRVEKNLISCKDSNGNPSSNGIYIPYTATLNNMIVEKNSVTTANIGLQCDAVANSLVIDKNSFDQCVQAGVWITIAGNQITIEDNYFENCGSTGVTVQTSSSASQTVQGMIVAHNKYSSDFNAYFRNLVIRKNQFANNGTGTPYIISLSHVSGATIEDNDVLEQYTATYFVNLFWHGAYRGNAKRVLIDHRGGNSQFSGGLVGMSNLFTDYPYQLQAAMIVKDYSAIGRIQYQQNVNPFGNPINWPQKSPGTNTWTVTKNGTSEGLPVWEFTGNDTAQLVINLDTNSLMKGTYWRLHAVSEGSASATNALKFVVQVNTGSWTTIYSSYAEGTSWSPLDDALIYIPTNATQVQLSVQLVDTTNPAYLKYFDFCPASLEVAGHQYAQATLQAKAAPTTGTWAVGDTVINSAPAASGNMGWVCVAAGTPGTWKTYGTIGA